MNFLSSIYGIAVSVRSALYDGGHLRARRLEGAVISVGNLSAGGSGKTPFVMLLGELLESRGVKFDVLSRGYGRQSRGVRLVPWRGISTSCWLRHRMRVTGCCLEEGCESR